MDQTCARVSALQLAWLEESSRRMATGLRSVEPEENRGPEHRLIPEKWSTILFQVRKLNRLPSLATYDAKSNLQRHARFPAGQTPSPKSSRVSHDPSIERERRNVVNL